MRTLRPASPYGIAIILLASLLVAGWITFGKVQDAQRIWGGFCLGLLGIAVGWRLFKDGRLVLPILDQAAWAILISHTVLVSRIRDPRALADEQGVPIGIALEITIWCLILAYALGRLLQNLERVTCLWGVGSKYATMLFFLALASTLYAASPTITLAWSLKLFTILATASMIIDPRYPLQSVQRLIKATYWGLALMLVQFMILGALSPSSAVSRSELTGIWRLGGFLLGATALSVVGGMIAVLTMIDILAKRTIRYAKSTLIVSILVILLSIGRGGMFATALSMVLVVTAFKRYRLLLVFSVLTVLIFVLVPDLQDVAWDLMTRRQQHNELVSLTGRVPLWWAAMEMVWEKPILGWGYVSGSRVALLMAFRPWPAIHAHNAFIEILLTLGVVGLLALFLQLWKTTQAALRTLWLFGLNAPVDDRSLLALKIIALLVLLVGEGMLNAGFGGAPRYETATLVGCTFCADQLRRARRRDPIGST